jgi:hypothetical protein
VFFTLVTITSAGTLNVNSDSLSRGLNKDTTIVYKDSISAGRNSLRSYKDSTGIWVRDSLGFWRRDSSSVPDSIALRRHVTKRDTVIPIFQSPLSNSSYILNRDELQKNDYRYTPDYFKLFEFAYLSETGNSGAPDELYLYGYGTGNINYMRDGIPLNSIPYLLFDLNYVQSESVDSIEIIPSPRGFLYGTHNKPVSVNFLSKDFISKSPYTRIKYYQGAFGEAMFDGIFNSNIYKKLPVFFDVTNRKLDKRFTNSDFSSWQVTTQVKYLLSDSVNFSGVYSFNKIYKGLNGGVNVDTILNQGLDINTYLYDELSAPVNHYNTDMDVTQHNFSLRLLAKPLKGANTDLSVYYKFNSQSLNNIGDDINNYEKTKNKTEGLVYNQKYSTELFNLNLIANYEHSATDFILPPSTLQTSYSEFYTENLIALSGSADFNLTDKFKTSVFYKYSSLGYELLHFQKLNNVSNGAGVDFNLKASDDLSFYFGYSLFKDYFTNNYQGNAEFSGTISTSHLLVKLSAFTKNMQAQNDIQLLNIGYRNALLLLDIPAIYQYQNNSNVTGLAINLKYRFWMLSVENNSSYYTGEHRGEFNQQSGLSNIPVFYSKSGIFISDSLFSNNLNMKGGFTFTFYGNIKYYPNNFSFIQTAPAYILDFTLAGRIRNTATIYFTWGNLLDFKYYLIPYYPNLGRNVKFGVAWDLFN